MLLARAESCIRRTKGRRLVVAAEEGGLKVAVASSSTRRVVRTVLEARRLWPLFDAAATGDEVARKKPDPAIFLLACAARVAAPPERCLVLEDSMPGVRGARNAGIPVIAVPEVDPAAFEGLADAVVSDLHEARRLVRLTPRAG